MEIIKEEVYENTLTEYSNKPEYLLLSAKEDKKKFEAKLRRAVYKVLEILPKTPLMD